MDPSELSNIQQYIQLFGHAPPGIDPEKLKMAQALRAAQSMKAAAPKAVATPSQPSNVASGVQALLQRQAQLAQQEAALQ